MKKNYLFIILFVILGLLMANCTSSVPRTANSSDMEGTITISGAWALYPMVIRWSEEFQKHHPGVQFDISAGGAGKGMADAISGAVDIGMVSREIYPEEKTMGALGFSVAKDAVFLTINENNPVWNELKQQGISRESLVDIFITGNITNWGQVVGRPEVTEPIHIFTRSDACGAAATWAEYLGGAQEDLVGIGVYGDPGVLDAVIKDSLGIGFNNLNYAFDFDTSLPVKGAKIVPLDINNNGIANPNEIYDTKDQALSAVARDYYPSPPARNLNLVTNGNPEGLVKAFITWIYLDGQQFLSEMGYVALPQEKLDQELGKIGN